jgi:hypothetical protein
MVEWFSHHGSRIVCCTEEFLGVEASMGAGQNECFMNGMILLTLQATGHHYGFSHGTSFSWRKVESSSTFTSLAYKVCIIYELLASIQILTSSSSGLVPYQMLINARIVTRMQSKRFSREDIMILASDTKCGCWKSASYRNIWSTLKRKVRQVDFKLV